MLVTFVQNFKSSFCEMVNLQFNIRYECMLNRLLLISLEVCLNLVLVNIRLLDYYQRRDGCRYVSPYLVTNLITSICTVKW